MQMAKCGDNLVYKHAEDSWLDARVNIYCKLSHLTIISDAMARVGMLGRWEQGVFKQFLGMNNELFNESYINQSVNSLHEVVPGSVYHRYFGGSPTPLKDILGRLSGEEFDEPEDVIKLGYVYFLSHILLGREYRWFVPDWLWGLVEDITGFEAFPWGTYIYSVTLYWLVAIVSVLGDGGHPSSYRFGWKAEKMENGPWVPTIDEHDEAAYEVHVAHEDKVSDDQNVRKQNEVGEELHGAQEDEVDKGAAEQDVPKQDEVNCVVQEQNRRRSKRLRK
ncbi:hypothetical protein Ddye_031065 [Dipteronia dyeriana]|uniref:DUF1985 domain-containing protein n=1 Tax=Dipteronia dyeriana TaxID=168575 RepID=A0AAD9WNA9_9ROSI|nr:hypothetical protein Ddye_031065 [Dipteronia dyeriana]